MDATPLPAPPETNPEFAVLQGSEANREYFAQVSRASSLLLKWYGIRSREGAGVGKDTFETAQMQDMLLRFNYTLEALRMKHLFQEGDSYDRLRVDLTDSGFPNRHEIGNMQIDLSTRQQALRELPLESMLKSDLVDYLFREKRDPPHILAKLGLRTYLEMLDESKLFLPYVTGNVSEWKEGDDEGVRGFITGWACYGAEKNAPYTYVMHFTQDTNRPPLHTPEGKKDLSDLAQVIREEGSRVPPLAVLGDQIDDQVKPIHPKFFKRTRVGPFYSRLLLEQRPEMDLTSLEKKLLDLLRLYGRDDDFVLMTSEEVLFSHAQYQGTRFLMPTKLRQAFWVDPTNKEAYEEGASRIFHYAILPHRILQNLSPEDMAQLPSIARCAKRIGYDTQGEIHEVS